jgi:hypothetical protein
VAGGLPRAGGLDGGRGAGASALQLLEAAGQGVALGAQDLDLLVPLGQTLLDLGQRPVQLGFLGVERLQLVFQARHALLGGQETGEQDVDGEGRKQDARRNEEPRDRWANAIHHGRDSSRISVTPRCTAGCIIGLREAFVELRRFFDRAIRASFADLAHRDDPAVPYLADLLTRFARTDNLFPRGSTVPRLETVADMLVEIQGLWDAQAPSFRPEREVSVRRHIGDFTLFMTGLFRERVERAASTGYYIVEGKRAYRFVSEHARAREALEAPYGRLAERFESYASVLDYTRRVHFFDHPAHAFFDLRFE